MRNLALAAMAALFAWPVAAAEPVCTTHESAVTQLADNYGETRQAIGIVGGNSVLELFANLETGTWTITISTAGGQTCLAANGVAFELIEEALPGQL